MTEDQLVNELTERGKAATGSREEMLARLLELEQSTSCIKFILIQRMIFSTQVSDVFNSFPCRKYGISHVLNLIEKNSCENKDIYNKHIFNLILPDFKPLFNHIFTCSEKFCILTFNFSFKKFFT